MRVPTFALLIVLSTSLAHAAPPFEPYAEQIPGADVSFPMAPISGGKFLMGSPADEAGRDADEGPQVEVTIEAYWMSVHEVTWAQVMPFLDEYSKAVTARRLDDQEVLTALAARFDAVTLPTPPYVEDAPEAYPGFKAERSRPAVNMTHYAACQFTKWLSLKTGHFYRLPTEAEWEYAARAGSGAAYSFGADVKQLSEYGWFFDNSDDRSHPVGQKRPNAWGLYDMHGNVAEWVFDQYRADAYQQWSLRLGEPRVVWPTKRYPHAVRGGSWLDDAVDLRSAARAASEPDFSLSDVQVPQSITWHTDAEHVGFRIVRPLNPPDEATQRRFWETADPEAQRLLEAWVNHGRDRRVPIERGKRE